MIQSGGLDIFFVKSFERLAKKIMYTAEILASFAGSGGWFYDIDGVCFIWGC